MMQDAINTLAELQQQFKNSYSIEILADGSILLFYMKDIKSDETFSEEFTNSIELLEWMEEI